MARIQEFDFSVNLLKAILWQYNDAARLQSLLTTKSEWYTVNQTEFWENWIRDVFDMDTANEFGLSVWGVILALPLSIGQPGSGAREVFGFGDENQNFENGTFGRDAAGISALTVDQKRIVIKLRYYQLVADGSVPWANYVCAKVLGMGYAQDPGNMTMNYVFPVNLPSLLRQVIEQYDLLPRPAGVKLNILVDPGNVFGFDPYYLNFTAPFGA